MIFYILHDDVMQLLNETARPVGHRTSDIVFIVASGCEVVSRTASAYDDLLGAVIIDANSHYYY